MIKGMVSAIRDGRPVRRVVIGLVDVDMAKLREGTSIMLPGPEVQLAEDVEIVLIGGRTDEGLLRDIRANMEEQERNPE